MAERINKFNDDLLALRQKKMKVLEELDVLAAELKTIQGKLDAELHIAMPLRPELHRDEMPEKCDISTMQSSLFIYIFV